METWLRGSWRLGSSWAKWRDRESASCWGRAAFREIIQGGGRVHADPFGTLRLVTQAAIRLRHSVRRWGWWFGLVVEVWAVTSCLLVTKEKQWNQPSGRKDKILRSINTKGKDRRKEESEGLKMTGGMWHHGIWGNFQRGRIFGQKVSKLI